MERCLQSHFSFTMFKQSILGQPCISLGWDFMAWIDSDLFKFELTLVISWYVAHCHQHVKYLSLFTFFTFPFQCDVYKNKQEERSWSHFYLLQLARNQALKYICVAIGFVWCAIDRRLICFTAAIVFFCKKRVKIVSHTPQ